MTNFLQLHRQRIGVECDRRLRSRHIGAPAEEARVGEEELARRRRGVCRISVHEDGQEREALAQCAVLELRREPRNGTGELVARLHGGEPCRQVREPENDVQELVWHAEDSDAALRDQALRLGVVRVAAAFPSLRQGLLNLHG